MTNQFNVIGSDVISINEAQNTVYVSKYSADSDNQKQFIPTTPQVSSQGGGNGLSGGQQRIQVILPTNSTAYDVNNSAFKYTMRFMLDTSCPYWQPTTSNGFTDIYTGEYTLFQGYWFFRPFTLVAQGNSSLIGKDSPVITPFAFDPVTGVTIYGNSTVTPAEGAFTTQITQQASMDVNGGFPGYAYNMEWVPCDEAYCLGSGPYNSMCALFQTNVQHAGLNDDDIRTFRHFLTDQLTMAPAVQDQQPRTWFYGSLPAITFSVLPYVIDQCPVLADGTTPNPRHGTRVPDGRFWNPHNSSTYQSIRPCGTELRDLMYGKNDADKSLPLLAADAAPVPYYQGSWLYGTKRTRAGTGVDLVNKYTYTLAWKQHQFPDLTCGYKYVLSGGVWTPELTPGKGGMNELISFPVQGHALGSCRYAFVQNLEMCVPMRYLSPAFDTENPLFYANALKTGMLNIWLITHQQSMADVWGNTRMFGLKMTDAPEAPKGAASFTDSGTAPAQGIGTVSDTKYYSSIIGLQSGACTAMIDAFFFADQKMSPLLNSDLQAGQLIASKTSKKHWTGVGTFNTTQAGTQNYPLMRALRNMKSIEIQVCPNDTNAVDNGVVGYPDDPRVQTSGSLYLHQHCTLFTEQQATAAQNQRSPDIEFNYLGEFNIRLSNKPSSYMFQATGAGLKSIQQFKHETLASNNLICNKLHASMPYLFQYGDNCIFQISAEKFANMLRQDISFDGVDTTGQPVMLQWGIWTYDLSGYSPATNIGRQYNSQELEGPALPPSGYLLEVFQEEEQWLIINPMTGSIDLKNDIRGLGIPINVMQ